MEELISIILPVYNGEKYLRESIDSVLSQTYQNWELLIVDDCSSDSTPAIAAEYTAKDSRVRYYRNEENLRLPRNLNRGFSLAKGDLLTWTSDDNRFRPTALERMRQRLAETGAEFVFASCRIINDDGEEVEYNMVCDACLDRVVGSNPVGACFLYTRKVYEAVGEYNPELTLVEDFDYWQRIIARFPTATIEDILYDYRWHAGALTSTKNEAAFCAVLEKMLLQNRPLFGRLSGLQSYYYYEGLSKCRERIGAENPYRTRRCLYSIWYLLLVRIPAKLKRVLKK